MKRDTVEKIISLIFKYVWILCVAIIFFESIATVFTVQFLMVKTTNDIIVATKNEIENEIDTTLKLAEALSKDYNLTNYDIDMIERGRMLKPYNEVYDLFLVGLTDEKGIIVSSYDDIPGDIGHRDYFKRVIQTGKPEITDVILAGADGVTRNYTICYPFFNEDGSVKGTVIMAIYYDTINDIATRALKEDSYRFSIMNSQNVIMSDMDPALIDKTFLEAEGDSLILGTDLNTINQSMLNKENGSYWVIYDGVLQYILYTPIENTNWGLNVQTDVLKSVQPIIMQFVIKSIIYIAIFAAISIFGRRYTTDRLKTANSLIKQITSLQYELQSQKILDSSEISELVELSKKGIFDSLTKLPVRSVFLRQQQMAFSVNDMSQTSALIAVDLDTLKQINDEYGHSVGDLALKHCGECMIAMSHMTESLVCRYGGDEFIAYVPYKTINELTGILNELIEKLHTTIELEGKSVDIHCSIGVSLYPKNGTDFDTLYNCADSALYQAKEQGRDRYVMYTSDD